MDKKKERKFIVHITRIEKYEADIMVSAKSKRAAEKIVEDAWGDGEHDWIYEKMTDVLNCDSQTYKAHEALPEDKPDFSL